MATRRLNGKFSFLPFFFDTKNKANLEAADLTACDLRHATLGGVWGWGREVGKIGGVQLGEEVFPTVQLDSIHRRKKNFKTKF